MPTELIDAGGETPVVLVVDDEPVLRAAMVRGLARLPGIDVIDAGSLREAVELVDAVQPRLVISDLDLLDGTGLDVLDALDRRRQYPPVMFVSAYTRRYAGKVPIRSNVSMHEKPVPLEVLRAEVVARLGVDAEAEAPFSATDYIQLACMGNRSVEIDLVRGPAVVGTITVRSGELWSARDRHGKGNDALRRLLHDPELRPRCAGVRTSAPARDIEGPWQGALLEAARVHDETTRRGPASRARPSRSGAIAESAADVAAGWDDLIEASAGEPAVPSATAVRRDVGLDAAVDAEFDLCIERGIDALLRKDYPSAHAAFTSAAAITPDDPRVRANLVRLAQLGFGDAAAVAGGAGR
jgi:CheY-like chemotaxis protein